tara:strand:- start:788 stop:1534 length:747 start_codon:yes stop_codon:yes gene_type:complete
MVLHIITYATHSEGLYDELVNNKFGIKIKVLGWGEKWKGFMEKVKVCNEYIRELNKNDVVVVLDGFDTKINRDGIDEIIPFMKDSGKRVIFSKNIENHMMGLEKVVFDYCIDKYIANCGMYMGFAKYLNIVLDKTLQLKCKDDQVNVNKLCNSFDFIGIDTTNTIFENLTNQNKTSNAVFVQYPGTITFNRSIRAIKEYTQFFINYLLILNIILLVYFTKYKKKISFIILILFNIILFCYIDKSCIHI